MVLSIFTVVVFTYLFRLFYIQVIDDTYQLSAENQALLYVTQYPSRGLIYDREGQLLAYNEAAYDLMVIPRNIKNLDTAALAVMVGINLEEATARLKKAKKYSRYKASAFEKLIKAADFGKIAEQLYKFEGFYGRERMVRKYTGNMAGHVLGYLNEINKKQLKDSLVNEDQYYTKGDYIGANGIEKHYEWQLRGHKGQHVKTKDARNVVQGSYRNGQYDQAAIAGLTLQSSLCGRLQRYGESLMVNKRGSVVALEPTTGEILTLISSPTFDPNLLVGRDRGVNYAALNNNDSMRPLFNRAMMAQYPPGSIFKMVQALIGLQEGVLTENTGFVCNKALVGCHNHSSPSDVTKAIQFSCNPYFYNVFQRILLQGRVKSLFKDSELGMHQWVKHVKSFGFGQRLGVDFPYLKQGSVPGVAYYDRIYGRGRWAFSTIYSLSIGQGELQVVPLQMANLAAIIANKGYYYIPHLVKGIGEKKEKDELYRQKQYTTIKSDYFNWVAEAMRRVVEAPGGTAGRAKIEGITVCGKTGTAENPHGEDHSVFIAFAPMENPQIAIAVYVENAGFGGTWAAPIASLMIEKYLTDSISDLGKEKRILEANLLFVEKDED